MVPEENSHAISVIIPMYNAEKYIEQCLESLRTQTFQNFEIIVVDDCSTDRSVDIVEQFVNSWGGTLHLLKRKKNSGCTAVPRNLGLRFAHGKYIAFLDNDDMFTSTALDELFSIAEQTKADVLHAEKWFSINEDVPANNLNGKISVTCWERTPNIRRPELITSDIGERIVQFAQRKLFWHVWSKLFRRDFLAKNCIEFPVLKIADDMLFSFYCICLAENYVRIPNIFNLYRVRKDSASNDIQSDEHLLRRTFDIILRGTTLLDEFMSKLDFFKQHGEFKHIAINFFVQNHFAYTLRICAQLPPHVIEDMLYKECAEEMGKNSGLLSYLFLLSNLQQAQLMQVKQQLIGLQQQYESLKNTLGK